MSASRRGLYGKAFRPITSSPTVPDWPDAVCRTVDPELFFPEPDGQAAITAAKMLCAQCPYASQCAEYAIANHFEDGIWGGLTPKERRSRRDDTAAATGAVA